MTFCARSTPGVFVFRTAMLVLSGAALGLSVPAAAMDGEAALCLPAFDGTLVAFEVGGYGFPGVKPPIWLTRIELRTHAENSGTKSAV